MNGEQSKEVTDAQRQSQMCVKCYEFWGNPTNMNMCSKCYRDHASKKETEAAKQAEIRQALAGGSICTPVRAPEVSEPTHATPTPTPAVEKEPVVKESPSYCPVSSPSDSPFPMVSDDQPPPQKHKNRCFSCNKKIGLTGFTCRCGYIFCSEHRYSDKHECTFDYKLAGREVIAKANPKVMASKINKI